MAQSPDCTYQDIDRLFTILARYRVHPEEWPTKSEDRERYNPFFPDPADVKRRAVAPILATMPKLTPSERTAYSPELFKRGLATMDASIVTTLLLTLDRTNSDLRLSLTEACQLLGLANSANLLEDMASVPQAIYHAFTNVIATCLRFGLGPDVIDPTILLFCSGNPDLTALCTINFPAADPVASGLFFRNCSKISAGHAISALRALPSDFPPALLSAHMAQLYQSWVARTLSPLRRARTAAADEPHVGELVRGMQQYLTRWPDASEVIARDLCGRFLPWLGGSQRGEFVWSQAGVELRARVFPNAVSLRSHLLGKDECPRAFEPESAAPFAVHPTSPVLYVSDVLVAPWLDAHRILTTLFTAVEQALSGHIRLAHRMVPFVVVGPLLADVFHALDVRYGWERMVGSEDVYAVCPPRLGDPRREPEYFYWVTPLARTRIALMHAILGRQARQPTAAWFHIQHDPKVLATAQVCERVARELAEPSAHCVFAGTKTTLGLLFKPLRPRRLVIKSVYVAKVWASALLPVLMNFLVELCRVWALEMRVESIALDLLDESIATGKLWKGPYIQRPLPRFYDGVWQPLPRVASAPRPAPRAPRPGENEAATLWVRQREEDLAASPRAAARPMFEPLSLYS
jgi:hypothetical protein